MANEQKQTERFQEAIRAFLNKRAKEEPAFALCARKPGKSVADCCNYIINEVKKSGKCGFADEEIFALAVHYYDEDNLQGGTAPQCSVVINQEVKLSNEEIEELRRQAREKVLAEEMAKLRKPNAATANTPKTESNKPNELALF